MNRTIIWLTLIVLWLAGPVNASTWTIMDNYIGGIHTGSWSQKDGDVISLDDEIDYFDIDLMYVTIGTNGDVNVKIQTGYDPGNTSATSYDKITYGDLFVSTEGRAPNETEESWEFALNTVSRNIYAVNEANIQFSNDIMTVPESWYRQNEEVLYDTTGQTDINTFTFNADDPDFISYAFNLAAFDLTWEDELDLGFHWAMTCANDVIEGSIYKAPVPEPGTMLLLGLGIIGLGAVGRRYAGK